MRRIKNTLDNCILSNAVQRNTDNSDDQIKNNKPDKKQTKKLPFKPLTKIAVSSRIKLGELLAGKEL